MHRLIWCRKTWPYIAINIDDRRESIYNRDVRDLKESLKKTENFFSRYWIKSVGRAWPVPKTKNSIWSNNFNTVNCPCVTCVTLL